ncbi:glycosyl transferase [Alicyclobacillus hesperidum subsp. aegles]|uniref:glycosyltransferase family 2 protein n=1 Tax=Alicyclobacillus hesperidum TaxID=89784 RepID=UPI00071926DE|nr:glycosyltransferase family 2 protein [Alicyclobacillus hesperidum]GLG02039.1 glycosyl transferase [Alicyclobacillus hesperidum subsp. aegles]
MISVILLTYNSLRVVPNCLASLERCSSSGDLEVIVADNGSTDGTLEWLKDYQVSAAADVFAAFRLLPLAENRGFAYGNNRAMEESNGDFILLLNPDTVVGERAIEVCLARLKENPGIGAIGCRLELPSGVIDKACRRSLPTLWNSFSRLTRLSFLFPESRLFSSYNLTYLDEFGSYEVECICGAFMMVPKQVYRIVGGLDEDYFMYGEDVDWCRRIIECNFKVWYEGNATTVHLKGGNGGKSTIRSRLSFYGSMWRYVVKAGIKLI